MALEGKECVILLSDLRYGEFGYSTVEMNFSKINTITPKILLGSCGISMHIDKLYRDIRMHKNIFQLEHTSEIKIEMAAQHLAQLLYKARFNPYYVYPLLAGLTSENSPSIYCYDLIGTLQKVDGFVSFGSGSDQVTGLCETLWKPNLSADELLNVGLNCFINGVNRDCFSGWGVIGHVLTPTSSRVVHVKMRMD